MFSVSSDRDGMTTVEPSASISLNRDPSLYSLSWMSLIPMPLPRSTVDDNHCNPPIPDNYILPSTDEKQKSSPNQPSNRQESISSPDQSSDRWQSISSHDQKMSPPFDYGEMVTYYSSLADQGYPSSSDNDPGISSSRPIIFNDKNDKDIEPPMILFDEHGDMHRNYYTPPVHEPR